LRTSLQAHVRLRSRSWSKLSSSESALSTLFVATSRPTYVSVVASTKAVVPCTATLRSLRTPLVQCHSLRVFLVYVCVEFSRVPPLGVSMLYIIAPPVPILYCGPTFLRHTPGPSRPPRHPTLWPACSRLPRPPQLPSPYLLSSCARTCSRSRSTTARTAVHASAALRGRLCGPFERTVLLSGP
jgi:hypothetical protein